eukprot:CAMPEP_0174839152 /NCGR_PEP_ID=MMETSP1114-20130205/7862_1 /TAXON_ID=312471 /ORGANISM="Neobodo designis, Strain CCAP 1951/1" /LENGTH=273 /DNA_ID=CAMNT_0016073273 /DNA_START=151 /DNA_END=972 /DNA_ORIENTATION=+
MLCRTSAIIPLKKRSQRNQKEHCACTAASTFLSLTSGAAAAAFSLLSDEKDATVADAPTVVSPVRRNPFGPATGTAVDAPTAQCRVLGYAVPCPAESPVAWTWAMRDAMTDGVVAARRWVRTATALDASPGALAVNGSVASVAAIGGVVPPPVMWCAAVSLFAIGAVDKYAEIRVSEALARAGAASASSTVDPAAAAAAASPSVLTLLRPAADGDIGFALSSPGASSLPHAFGFALGGAAARYAHKMATMLPKLASLRNAAAHPAAAGAAASA